MPKFKDSLVHFGEKLKKGYGKVKEGFAKAKSFGSKLYKNPFVKGVVDAGVAYAKDKHPQLASAVQNIKDTASGKKGILDGIKSAKVSFSSKDNRKELLSSGKDIIASTAKRARKDAEGMFNEHSKKVLGGGSKGGGGGGIV